MTPLQIIGAIVIYFVIGWITALVMRFVVEENGDFVCLFFWPLVIVIGLFTFITTKSLDAIQDLIEGIRK
jgi:hypothetical protein